MRLVDLYGKPIERERVYEEAPVIANAEVRLAFEPGGEFYDKLRLTWHPWDHTWNVFQRVTDEWTKAERALGLDPPEWEFLFEIEERHGGTQPDMRLINHLRMIDKARRAEEEVNREVRLRDARTIQQQQAEKRTQQALRQDELMYECRKQDARGPTSSVNFMDNDDDDGEVAEA